MFINERLFAVFDIDKDLHLNIDEFLNGMKMIFGGTYEELINLVFSIYDSDFDKKINSQDIKRVFLHIPLNTIEKVSTLKFKYEKCEYSLRVESQEEVQIYLEKMFENKIWIDESNFQYIVENISSEAFLFVN